MNKSSRTRLLSRTVIALSIVLVTLLTAQVVLAYADLVLAHFTVSLSDPVTFNADGTSIWTYKVEVTSALHNAVSHATLGIIDPECQVVGYSSDGGSFKTEEKGNVVTWEVNGEGIKNVGEYYTFTFTVVGAKQNDYDPNGTSFLVKYGTAEESGSLAGPICGTTAVTMASVTGDTGTSALLLLLAIVATSIAVAVLRRGEER